MRRIRVPVAMLILWLFFVYNIERLGKQYGQMNIAPVTYLLVAATALIVILLRRVQHVRLWLLLPGLLALFVALKLWSGAEVWDESFPVTVTEAASLAVTALLARWASFGVAEFEHAVANISIGRQGERRARQGEIYREVQRARIHQRPLALLAVRPDGDSVSLVVDRIVQEAQQTMVQQYVQAGISRALCGELDDYNIIAKRKDYFLVVVPEATADKLPELIRRLRRAVRDEVGVDVHVGVANLPADATTLEGLASKALGEMRREPDPAHAARTAPNLVLENVQVSDDAHGHSRR